MKKSDKTPITEDDGMLPEYDFRGKKGIRGKYYRDMQKGYTIRIHNQDGSVTEKHIGPSVTLDPDVSAYFPDSESVNKALRALISLVPKKQVGEKKPKYVVRKKATKSLAARK